jgi:DNA-binding response OmpR family regulator
MNRTEEEQKKLPIVFIADDDDDDVSFLKSALKEVNTNVELIHFYNGRQLMNQLTTSSTSPDLIILDLNMPVLDGRETLKQIRDNSKYERCPVIILSTSTQPNERTNCTRMGADEYFPKPYNYSNYIDIVRNLKDRWLDQVAV